MTRKRRSSLSSKTHVEAQANHQAEAASVVCDQSVPVTARYDLGKTKLRTSSCRTAGTLGGGTHDLLRMLAVARRLTGVPLRSVRAFSAKDAGRRSRRTAKRAIPSQSGTPSSRPNDNRAQTGPEKEESGEGSGAAVPGSISEALRQAPDELNSLVAPVHIPEDANGVLKETHPAMQILNNSAIVIHRQLEMMNVLVGFEQANRYIIMDPHGNHIGYLAELDGGMGKAVQRQMFRTHRSFTTHVFDRHQNEVLRFHRPFSWISSRISIYDAVAGDLPPPKEERQSSLATIPDGSTARLSPLALSDMRVVGSTLQEWAPLRRKYNLFLARDSETAGEHMVTGDLPLSKYKSGVSADSGRPLNFVQFARVDDQFLAWNFHLRSEDGRLIGTVNRNFAGFARELFTDTGVYALRMDAAGLVPNPSQTGYDDTRLSTPRMTLDQRAVLLATAVTIDFDYFSRHSGPGGFLFPWFIPMEGGAGAAAGEAGGAATTGLAEGAATGAVGAGGIAGLEALQQAREQQSGGAQGDDASPIADDIQAEDIWKSGSEDNSWMNSWGNGKDSGGGGGDGGKGADGGDGGGSDGGDFDVGDWF